MSLTDEPEAWLERENEQHILYGSCSIGRAALNTLVLDSPKVSRLHSVIRAEDTGAFWLIDLGSSNGTFLNKRRIHEPVRLRDRDQVAIGGNNFTFRQPHGKPSAELWASGVLTLQELETVPCWLLVADIEDFTPLSRSLPSADLSAVVSGWLASCKRSIEKHAGIVNKYLGDGILAYWRDGEDVSHKVAGLIGELKEKQNREQPRFRFVLHFGLIAISGLISMREEALMGSDVNLVFRLEKLAGSLDQPCGISGTAQARLVELITARALGDYELKGFETKCALYAV